MKINHIQIENVRIIRNMELEPCSGLNFIYGDNGAGKTSVLEAVFLLGQGKSFRHSEAGPLITKGQKRAQVVADLQSDSGTFSKLGIQRSNQQFIARHAGKDVSKRSKLFRLLPLQLITPQSHELIERGPELRRRYLDFGLFHVEPSYHQVLMSYHRALKQRNAALRNRDIRLAQSFNSYLVTNAKIIADRRQWFLAQIERNLEEFLSDLNFPAKVSLDLSKGWKSGISMEEALVKTEVQDLAQGFTSAGIHRAQLKILADKSAANKILSRGQQKLLVYGLVFSVSKLIKEKIMEAPLLLIDDLNAELDDSNARKILEYLQDFGLQLFITTLDIQRLGLPEKAKVFHVKHGST
ncbi:MAG TPA: DNA replication and repair protein RecF [Desulfobacteraceae bacterium]|nr:DNA replication and repair protein RecF [Desulfobacteraceae bacterium]